MSDIKEVGASKSVLACHGGMDALVILNWLQSTTLEYLLLGRVTV
jgi:argininosuccinate synthase